MPAAKPLDKPIPTTDPQETVQSEQSALSNRLTRLESVVEQLSPLDRLIRLEAIVEQLQDNLYGVNVRPAALAADSDEE